MKSNSRSSLQIPALLAATLVIAGSADAADYTVGVGETLNLSNGSYTGANLLLQGGTVSGSGNYNAYGASVITGVAVSGSAPSTITGSSWFNIVDPTTFTVADVTGDAVADLLVNTSLRALPGNPDNSYSTAKIIKEGMGTMEVTVHSYFRGGLDLNGGTLKLSGGNSGYGFFDGAVTINSGTILTINSDGTGFGYQNSWKPTSVNINGGTVNGGGNHVWGISGGVNMTGGTLQVDGGSFQWNYTNLNTNASADTATLAGPLTLRGDGGYTGLSANVADGAAATDLLVSGNISQQYGALGISKSGDGTMVLSGNNSYTGATIVSAGTLVLSGTSATSAVTVNAGVLSLGNGTSSASLNDAISVSIASGAQADLNFTGTDVVGSLDIDGSGTLPAGLYNSSHPTYGSFFTGTGSLEILAQDGTWTSTANGNWSDSANWADNIIAVGIDNTATFSAATGSTVTLDSSRIIGHLAFDASDYTIAGGNTLSLDTASSIPVISVTAGRSATISAGLGGNDGMEKTGDGTLVLSGVKSYTGDTTVTAGILELNSTAYDVSVVNGTVTVADGATLKLSGLDYSGLGRLGSRITTLNVNGGSVNSSVESWVTGATVSLAGGSMGVTGSGRYQVINSTFISLASANTSTISGNLLVRKDYGSGDLNIEVDDGAAATDLSISGSIQQTLTTGLNKFGTGKLLLSGTNTYTGNTVVNDGTLEVASAGSLLFRPTTNGATNSVSGSGGGSLSFLGAVNLDLSAADTTDGNVWNLFQLSTLTGTAPVLAPTAITSGPDSFTEVSPGSWELSVTNAKWVFTEADGNLTYTVTATDFDNWKTANGVTGGENDDDDNDGLTNQEEYAFGLNPTGGASVNAISVALDATTGTFSYTRRQQSITGLNYSVWYSTDLATWTEDSNAVQGNPSLNGEVETVPVTLSPALLSNTKLFIQVRAQ